MEKKVAKRASFRRDVFSFYEYDLGHEDEVVGLARDFYKEAEVFARHTTADANSYRRDLRSKGLWGYVAYHKESGEIAGYVFGIFMQFGTIELVGDLVQFYVRKKYRGTQVGRTLVRLFDLRCEGAGCALSFFNAAGGTREAGQYTNMMVNFLGKAGFSPAGIECVKIYERDKDGKRT